ncbi:hypothetical protein [Desulfarculus baarsii]|nr:hypothetical protein [Desulfarculus baarsii]
MHMMFTAVTLALAIPLMAVIGFFVIWALKIRAGQAGAEHERRDSEETALIQEIYQGLERMEKRIEALETLVFDQESKGKS